ncbi:G-box-binding factor 1 [Silene latifolia]|uniref:G-box-binding factor 1 n=1 Tax=Silene latifolia TaxID=37657 RepID=UPI003D774428
MGAAEEQTPPKPSKSPPPAQETPTTMPPYADWSRSMQAYYNAAVPPPFYASTVPSPTPHPYMWSGQHPMMPPYGTPVHYPGLYPPGGVYAHPNIGTIVNTSAPQAEGKSSDVKDQSSAKKSRANSSAGNDKTIETGKATSGSANDGASQSAESGSEGSSDSSDENNQTENSSRKGRFDLMLEDGANAHNNASNGGSMGPVQGNPVPMPATNLNIGMDLWNGNAPAAVKLQPNGGVSSAVVPSMVMGEVCYDERELKKQKRKQSNRESARRSRLRKQAECEELQRKVECLNSENSALKDELRNLAEECMKLTAENQTIQEELKRAGKNDS